MLVALQDPVDGSAAVLVKRYNITQQKELELKLAEQQEALQRYPHFLHSHCMPQPCPHATRLTIS